MGNDEVTFKSEVSDLFEDQTEDHVVSLRVVDATISNDHSDKHEELNPIEVDKGGPSSRFEDVEDQGEARFGASIPFDETVVDNNPSTGLATLEEMWRQSSRAQHVELVSTEQLPAGRDSISKADPSHEVVGPNADDGAELATEIRDRLATINGLDMPGEGLDSQLLDYMIKSVARLSIENSMMKEKIKKLQQSSGGQTVVVSAEEKNEDTHMDAQAPTKTEAQKEKPQSLQHLTCHVVYCQEERRTYYMDVPRMFKGDSRADHLRGKVWIENLSKHLERHTHVSFAVVKGYYCSCMGGKRTMDYHRVVGHRDGKLIDDSKPAESRTRFVSLSVLTREIITKMMTSNPERFAGFRKMVAYEDEPFYIYYVLNRTFLDLLADDSSQLDDTERLRVKPLCNWFEENCRKDWDEADEMLARGKINAKHYPKLFRPDELVVWKQSEHPGIIRAAKTKPYPWNGKGDQLDAITWSYNGVFERTELFGWLIMNNVDSEYLNIKIDDGEVDITSLPIYPMRFAEAGLHAKLIARGHKFWSCRRKKLISYADTTNADAHTTAVDYRYMVDYTMFRRMHPSKSIFVYQKDDLGEAMNKNEPPDDDFLAMLPAQIHAFDLSTKSWKLIRADLITDVTWNKDAFKRLVVPEQTKELIQAAVTAHGHRFSTAPDIIAGKGQGLLVLLHGGPGTGKTLTAESIAEAQERPIYRVTSGDVGINPVDVERYFQTVLTIGQAWGCVVLLDEADVFLEERNIADQTHNAIASVFLRVLEYYDGIIILTTNRVGTVDEAFKSRIHLAIRYHNLDEEQRVEIWRNFIQMLARAKEGADIDDLELNIYKLAQVELNGRQIRNVITLARYLAKFRKQILVYRHVQDALASVVKFDEYLLGLRGSDDRWAKESRLR